MKTIDATELMTRLNILCDESCPYSRAQRDVMCGGCLLGDVFDIVDSMIFEEPCETCQEFDCTGCEHKGEEHEG